MDYSTMAPTPTGEEWLAYLIQRRSALRKELKWVKEGIRLHGGLGSPAEPDKEGSQHLAPIRAVRRLSRKRSKRMGQTFRDLILEILAESQGPLAAPEIARVIEGRGIARDYKHAKDNVDTVVKRLHAAGHAMRSDDGWRITESGRRYANNGHP